MKLTVITKGKGEIVGFAPSAPATALPGTLRAGLMAGPGQQMHEVDVPDDFNPIFNLEKAQEQVRTLLQKK